MINYKYKKDDTLKKKKRAQPFQIRLILRGIYRGRNNHMNLQDLQNCSFLLTQPSLRFFNYTSASGGGKMKIIQEIRQRKTNAI